MVLQRAASHVPLNEIPLPPLPSENSIIPILFIHSPRCLFHPVWTPSFKFSFMVTHWQSILQHHFVLPPKCKAAGEAAIRTLFLPCHLLLGHSFHNKALMDSFEFLIYPGKHLARRAGSRWWGFSGQGRPFLYLHQELDGQNWCLSFNGMFKQW